MYNHDVDLTEAFEYHPRQPGFERANGALPIRLGIFGLFKTVVVHGGRYEDCFVKQPGHVGVCLLEHPPRNGADLHIPIQDFSVPVGSPDILEGIVKSILKAAIDGKQVFVGCRGGLGRTGLMLALLAKVAGVPDAVAYVRRHYNVHAVETKQQEQFVADFPVHSIRRWLFTTTMRAHWPVIGYLLPDCN